MRSRRGTRTRFAARVAAALLLVVPFFGGAGRADAAPDARALSEALAVFDGAGSGDHDHRVEWPDLNPDALAARLRGRAAGSGPERRRLLDALGSVSRLLSTSCLGGTGDITASDIRCLLQALDRASPGLVKTERLGDELGAVRTDSLRGIHDGADPPAKEPWLLAYLVLNGLDVPTDTRVQSGFARGFPVDPDEVAQWFPNYVSLAHDLVTNLASGPTLVDVGPPDARVSIRGRTSATLHEAVSTPAELEAEGFLSPGMLFLRGEHLDPSTSLVETGVHHIEQRMSAEGRGPGGFFLATYGANDLFTFRQILIGAREVEPAEFEADLRQLDRKTSSLVERGVRRIYVLPPPVDALFTAHVLPRGARFTDGSTIPAGSTTLHQWWLAAAEGRRLPRQVVLLAEQLAALRERQDDFAHRAERVLGNVGNWLVVDTSDLFRRLLERIAGHGVVVDGVPGYGRLRYRGTWSMLSTDGVHPTRFGYLLWAEMVLEVLRRDGVALRHATPLAPFCESTPEDVMAAVTGRVVEQVRASPSFFRPAEFPFDPEDTGELDVLAQSALAFDGKEPRAWAAAYERSSWIWPFLPDSLLTAVAPSIDPTLTGTTLLHHEIVGRLRRVLEATPAPWTAERRAAYRRLLVAFVDDGRLATARHGRMARASLASLGMPDDDSARGYGKGHTPELFSGERTFRLGVEGVARADTRSGAAPLWGRAFIDDVPYRTPPSFSPLGFTDFTVIEGHVGLAALRPISTNVEGAAVHVEAWYTPIALTSYIDALPDLALTVELPSWRPVFAFGDGCMAFSGRCSSLLRFSEGIELSFWPFRDPAFRAGPWPQPALYTAFRGTYAFRGGAPVLGGGSLEGSAGFSLGF